MTVLRSSLQIIVLEEAVKIDDGRIYIIYAGLMFVATGIFIFQTYFYKYKDEKVDDERE